MIKNWEERYSHLHVAKLEFFKRCIYMSFICVSSVDKVLLLPLWFGRIRPFCFILLFRTSWGLRCGFLDLTCRVDPTLADLFTEAIGLVHGQLVGLSPCFGLSYVFPQNSKQIKHNAWGPQTLFQKLEFTGRKLLLQHTYCSWS